MQDFHVDEAYIQFNFSEHRIPLNPVESSGAVQLWKVTHIIPSDVNKPQYNYIISSTDTDKLVGKFFRQESNGYFKDTRKRKIGSPVRLDVLRFTTNNNHFCEIVSRAYLFYADWLLRSVNTGNIKMNLAQIINLGFSSLNLKDVKRWLEWFLKTAASPVDNVHCLYLCVVLAHLPGKFVQHLQRLFLNDKRTKCAFDRLLQCLEACSNSNFLSPSSLKLLKKIAYILVMNSSCPGWLTFAAHFYPYFGVKYVVVNSMPRRNYERDKYRRMFHLLLSHVTVNQHKADPALHQTLLQKIRQNAPDMDAARELSECENVNLFFASGAEKEDFFANVSRNRSAGKSAKPVKKLDEIAKILKMGSPEISRDVVHTSMLAFATSVGGPKQNEVEAFFQLIASDQDMPIDKVQTVLEQLSKSKSVRHHNLLQELLSRKVFEGRWEKVSFVHKLSICTSWIDTQGSSETQKHGSGTITVYRAIDDIMSCSLNVSDTDLAEHLWKNVSKRHEGVGSILKAFKNVENFSSVVQEGYKNHVNAILKENAHLLRKPSKTLKQWSESR